MGLEIIIKTIFVTILVITPLLVPGNITDIHWPPKAVYGYHDSIPIQVTFTNTGQEDRSFWVICLMQDSSGATWAAQEAIYTGRQTPFVRSGGNCTVGIQWMPQEAAPPGNYSAIAVLAKDFKDGRVIDELDRKIKRDAFSLRTPESTQEPAFTPWGTCSSGGCA